jgi:glyoxylase-like metal-dependent hydrolase (beta-lactamase superfamily II)
LTADADAIAKRLMRTGKRLSRVIITHAHPDHFLGAAALKAHFPDAQYLAREQTAAEIKKISGFARNAMAADYGDRFNSAAITFAPLQGGELRIGSAVLPLIDFVGGESHHQLAILLPDQSEVIASDLLYNGTHLYLADQDFAAWRRNLDRLSALGAARARPGHGQPGRTKDLVAKTLEYMAAFEEEAEKAPDAERLKARMISRYPNLAGVRLLEFSAASMFPADPSDR